MKKLIVVLGIVGMTAAAFAAPTANKPAKVPFNELPKEEQEARIAAAKANRLRRTGGEVCREGSQQGTILFMNAQKIVPEAELAPAVEALKQRSHLNIKIATDKADVTPLTAGEIKKAKSVDIIVFIVADEKSPTMLLNAPEDGWAIVNAAAVTVGARNDVFKAARLRKEMQRAFFSVAGAMNSTFPNSLMKAVRQPADLDKMGEEISLDAYGRTMENLKSLGVTPTETTTYLQACRLGWANPPTNDIQRTIWNQVHQIPGKPIKIEFDPNKDK